MAIRGLTDGSDSMRMAAAASFEPLGVDDEDTLELLRSVLQRRDDASASIRLEPPTARVFLYADTDAESVLAAGAEVSAELSASGERWHVRFESFILPKRQLGAGGIDIQADANPRSLAEVLRLVLTRASIERLLPDLAPVRPLVYAHTLRRRYEIGVAARSAGLTLEIEDVRAVDISAYSIDDVAGGTIHRSRAAREVSFSRCMLRHGADDASAQTYDDLINAVRTRYPAAMIPPSAYKVASSLLRDPAFLPLVRRRDALSAALTPPLRQTRSSH